VCRRAQTWRKRQFEFGKDSSTADEIVAALFEYLLIIISTPYTLARINWRED
jgi:hypothetical protein